MIGSIRATNFGRFPEVEVTFDEHDQLVMIAGLNGAGKSTLLGIVFYALYGESLEKGRSLSDLVRWGAELEGMEVEVHFTADDTEYSVTRKLVNKTSSAILHGNGNPLYRSPTAVTAEISRILGMDSLGFRLAVVAKQKELDALGSLTPGVRSKSLSRLLRLDAITRASKEAREIYTQERKNVQAIGSLDDLDDLRQSVDDHQVKLAAAQVALDDSAKALLALNADLIVTENVRDAYSKARVALARAEGAQSSAAGEVDRLTRDLAAIRVPEPVDEPTTSRSDLRSEELDVARKIAQAEGTNELHRERKRQERDLQQVQERLRSIEETSLRIGPEDITIERVAEAQAQLATAQEDLASVNERLRELAEQAGSADAEVRFGRERLDRLEETGPVCDACGQDVPETHRHAQEAGLEETVKAALELLDSITSEGRSQRTEQKRLQGEIARLQQVTKDAENDLTTLRRLQQEIGDLQRRAETYQSQIDRLPSGEVDMHALEARLGRLSVELAKLDAIEEAKSKRVEALSHRYEVEENLLQARARLRDAEAGVADAALGTDLQAAFKQREDLEKQKDEESQMHAYWVGEVGKAEAQLAGATAVLERVEKQLGRRREYERKAITADNSAKLLSEVADRIQTQIRPALEGAVSAAITTLSEGRFTSVKVTEEYDILVEEQGSYRPLTFFSGGERDLIALAMRLSLASVITDRHGSSGAGFLILDECFGSQDAVRRDLIINALRNLRTTYGQILLISHVTGMEDVVDAIVEVSVEEDEDGNKYSYAKRV